jgi:hypothetical protein
MFVLKSAFVHYGCILTLAAMLTISSCSRASGPAFAGTALPESSKAGIYLYRRSALAAYGQPFTVLVDGKPVGQLANASYIRLPLTPGRHTLQIAPGGIAPLASVRLQAVAGANAFYEFVFPTAWQMLPSFDGAGIETRVEPRALSEMRGLRSM